MALAPEIARVASTSHETGLCFASTACTGGDEKRQRSINSFVRGQRKSNVL